MIVSKLLSTIFELPSIMYNIYRAAIINNVYRHPASRVQAPAYSFWASQHEEVSGFTNFALSPALAPLS